MRKTVWTGTETPKQEIHYYVTSGSKSRLGPRRFFRVVRGHWTIENGLHHVKDRSWFEDHQYAKSAKLGSVLTVLRDSSLNALRTLELDNGPFLKSLPRKALHFLGNCVRGLKQLLRV